ncbi:MAG: hypothetical protein WAZ12_01150 [Candidatus Absconditicoccaceae bacterium]
MPTNTPIQTLNELPDFSSETLSDKTATELFSTLQESDSLKDFLDARFDDICYLQINPNDPSQYASNPIINDIVTRHIRYAEYHPIEIMFFKINENTLNKAQQTYEEMKLKYGDMIEMNKTKRVYIVGFFGGTSGRTNQYFIDQIKSQLPVKIMKI